MLTGTITHSNRFTDSEEPELNLSTFTLLNPLSLFAEIAEDAVTVARGAVVSRSGSEKETLNLTVSDVIQVGYFFFFLIENN